MKNKEEEKYCFVIMPISDNQNYQKGHFDRVYQHLIVPSCRRAGFVPIRADEVTNTNYIALDVVKKIVESEMVLCDLSSQNPNVLYELGIRQAFNKPVALMKDKKTNRIFDIQGFRDFEYDESLRVDNVENDIGSLSQMLESTYLKKEDDINSLISLLSLTPAKLNNNSEISGETQLVLNAVSSIEKRLSLIEREPTFGIPPITKGYTKIKEFDVSDIQMSIPEIVGEPLKREELVELSPGSKVFHEKFGFGVVVKLKDPKRNNGVLIGEFKFNSGIKQLNLEFARLRGIIE